MEGSSLPEQQRPSFLRRILKKIVPSQKPQSKIQKPTTIEPIPKPENPTVEIQEVTTPQSDTEVEKQPAEPRQLDIGTDFIKKLSQQGGLLKGVGKMRQGVKALGGTNETIESELIEKVRSQEQAPNGYLIGIGAANVFRMLELFPTGQLPKGIILFDIDTEVVREGQRFIEWLKTASDPTDPLYGLRFIISEDDERKKLAPILQKLAQEGNLVIAQADFTNEKVAEALNELPEIHEYNNVIYLSNISDYVWSRIRKENYDETNATAPPNFTFLESLKPKHPLKNYYVDTLQRDLRYCLRVSSRVPQFNREDLEWNGAPVLQTKPTDEIEGPTQNDPLLEDMSGWNIQQLTETYKRFMGIPSQQRRANDIELSIRRDRARTLGDYDYYKKKSQEEPEGTGDAKHKYVVPADPTEEAQVKQELTVPYSYENDFIPFMANTVWRNAIFPNQISPKDIPQDNRYEHYDPKEAGKFYIINDPRQRMKGEVEKYYINFVYRIITYEELVMAKLYKEIRRRVSTYKPNADLKGKSFQQLVQEEMKWNW